MILDKKGRGFVRISQRPDEQSLEEFKSDATHYVKDLTIIPTSSGVWLAMTFSPDTTIKAATDLETQCHARWGSGEEEPEEETSIVL